MNTGQCQTNAVHTFVNRAEKGASSGFENASSSNRTKSIQGPSATCTINVEQRFFRYSNTFDHSPSYRDAFSRTTEDPNQKFSAPKIDCRGTSWATDFKRNYTSQMEIPLRNELNNLNLSTEIRSPQAAPSLGFSRHTMDMASFSTTDHQLPKARNLELPINSCFDSLINAEFLKLEGNDLHEESNTGEISPNAGLEKEEAAMKGLASDIVDFCDSNSTDDNLKERLASSKFVGLMGNISDGSVILKKDEGTKKDCRKHVGFCFEGTESWAGFEFHDVEDRIA
ncbi:hypothetical protein SEUBUCD646_0O03260 [Saccharomyces eubayanus]|uniref:PEX18/PEX21 C-terminal domain-containing protein n=2 Tax=Saccharomyces TaxID=4930 RepID=A0A6C1EH04_SACPS|nr:hypothetical protein GRS66_010848 [Saccharomyces pastorianus]CAI1733906.1 hypothetical protein SEUBUCD650_0O03260 [Saccharomyces eubayanus]CAI1768193.1 hypothetical protein SEUBUCD646_0O03260 [Saccharomyces eubayanus]